MITTAGALIRGSGPAVYLMQAGHRRWIVGAETFSALGLDWNAIQTIADADLEAISRGPDFPSRADGAQDPSAAWWTDGICRNDYCTGLGLPDPGK